MPTSPAGGGGAEEVVGGGGFFVSLLFAVDEGRHVGVVEHKERI